MKSQVKSPQKSPVGVRCLWLLAPRCAPGWAADFWSHFQVNTWPITEGSLCKSVENNTENNQGLLCVERVLIAV